MGKKYLIAGMVTDIAYKFPYTAKMLEKYEYHGDSPVEVNARITVEDFLLEAKRLSGESENFIENSAVLRKLSKVLLLEHNAMLFHGSTVKYGNNAFVFTAPSGTGKSTHTALLKEFLGDKLTYINDDKPILKVENGKVVAYGSPWNGKHNLGENTFAPLKAICLVTRADKNSIERVSSEDFIKVLFEQCVGFDDLATASKVLEILDCILKNCKFYLLKCNVDISAAKCSFEGMMYED